MQAGGRYPAIFPQVDLCIFWESAEMEIPEMETLLRPLFFIVTAT